MLLPRLQFQSALDPYILLLHISTTLYHHSQNPYSVHSWGISKHTIRGGGGLGKCYPKRKFLIEIRIIILHFISNNCVPSFLQLALNSPPPEILPILVGRMKEVEETLSAVKMFRRIWSHLTSYCLFRHSQMLYSTLPQGIKKFSWEQKKCYFHGCI